jgi:hypothetical protein
VDSLPSHDQPALTERNAFITLKKILY